MEQGKRYGVFDLVSGKVVYWSEDRADALRWLQGTYPSLVDHVNKQGHYAGGQTEPEHIIEHACSVYPRQLLAELGVVA